MKLKPSKMLLIAMLLFTPSFSVFVKRYEVYGLIGWISLMVVLGVAASMCRSEEIKLERSAK